AGLGDEVLVPGFPFSSPICVCLCSSVVPRVFPRYNRHLTMSLGVYIQVPFCQTKCTYCNFHTGVVSRDRYQPYADALCREIETSDRSLLGGRSFSSDINESSEIGALAPEVSCRKVDSVYFGGGTPSLLDPAALTEILTALHTAFDFAPDP